MTLPGLVYLVGLVPAFYLTRRHLLRGEAALPEEKREAVAMVGLVIVATTIVWPVAVLGAVVLYGLARIGSE